MKKINQIETMECSDCEQQTIYLIKYWKMKTKEQPQTIEDKEMTVKQLRVGELEWNGRLLEPIKYRKLPNGEEWIDVIEKWPITGARKGKFTVNSKLLPVHIMLLIRTVPKDFYLS